jgi:hypothetical protein
MIKVVSVKFPNTNPYNNPNKTYAYSTDVEEIAVGDTVVVESPSSGFTCVKVTAIDESDTAVTKATKWVVCKVDAETYKARVEREKRKGVILAKLAKIQKEILERDMFSQLAALDTDAAKLVEELKNL